MLDNYLNILILLIVSVAVPLVAIAIGHHLGPRRPLPLRPGDYSPTPPTAEPYTSDLTTIGPARRRAPIKFYRIAALFVLFYVAVIFMYPWAVLFFERGEKALLFVEMLIFVAILSIGYVYAWKAGALEWD